MADPRLQALIAALRRWQPGAIAFSGGVDSTLLLRLAREAWDRPPLAVSCYLSADDRRGRTKRIRELTRLAPGIPLKTFKAVPPWIPPCGPIPSTVVTVARKTASSRRETFLERRGIPFLLDGTNADDLNENTAPVCGPIGKPGAISPFALMHWSEKGHPQRRRTKACPTGTSLREPALAHPDPLRPAPQLSFAEKRIARGEAVLDDPWVSGNPASGAHGSHRPNRGPGKEFPRLMKTEKPGVPVATRPSPGIHLYHLGDPARPADRELKNALINSKITPQAPGKSPTKGEIPPTPPLFPS